MAVGAGVLGAMMGGGLWAGPNGQDGPPATGPATREDAKSKKTREILQTKIVTMEMDGQELSMVLDFLGETTGLSIHAKWRAMEAAEVSPRMPVAVKLKNVGVGKVLAILLSDATTGDVKLDYAIDEGVIIISTAEDVKAARANPLCLRVAADEGSQGARKKLQATMAKISLRGSTIGSVVKLLGHPSGVAFQVREAALEKAGIDIKTKVTTNLTDVTMEQVLKVVLEDLSVGDKRLAYVIENGTVTISTAEDLKAKAGGGK